MPIRAVIFDMGGVILRTEDPSGRRKWESRLGMKEGELSVRVFTSKASDLASIGKLKDQDVWKSLQASLNLSDGEIRELEHDFWIGDRVDQQLVAFIQSLRGKYKTGILSNAWPRARFTITQTFGLGEAVDAIIISAEEGVAKPDPRIYLIAAEQLGRRPEECLFVDDVLANVQGAQSVGMQAVLFKNTPQAIKDVRERLREGPEES